MTTIWEPARQIPVWDEADVCVVGGSCTGVFAAIRAARMGLKVVLVENQGRLGGTATAGLVYIWHSLLDDTFSVPVIGGLTSDRAIKLVRGLKDLNIVGMDVVEVAPAYDQSEITALAAATLALEMLYIQAAKKGE